MFAGLISEEEEERENNRGIKTQRTIKTKLPLPFMNGRIEIFKPAFKTGF